MKKSILLLALCAMAHISAAEQPEQILCVPREYATLRISVHNQQDIFFQNTKAIEDVMRLFAKRNPHLRCREVALSKPIASARTQLKDILERHHAFIKALAEEQEKVLAELKAQVDTDCKTCVPDGDNPAVPTTAPETKNS